jgi:hypothetical protein
MVSDISKDPSALIFRVKLSKVSALKLAYVQNEVLNSKVLFR